MARSIVSIDRPEPRTKWVKSVIEKPWNRQNLKGYQLRGAFGCVERARAKGHDTQAPRRSLHYAHSLGPLSSSEPPTSPCHSRSPPLATLSSPKPPPFTCISPPLLLSLSISPFPLTASRPLSPLNSFSLLHYRRPILLSFSCLSPSHLRPITTTAA